jgi:hypothetical protein
MIVATKQSAVSILPVSVITARWFVHAIDFVEFTVTEHSEHMATSSTVSLITVLSNTQSDSYQGQSVKNRLYFFLRVFEAVRAGGKDFSHISWRLAHEWVRYELSYHVKLDS